MGASNSRMVEEDKALLLCRDRKKFIGQALDGRCNLAATHISYIEGLKVTGTALRRFVEPEGPVESSIYTSASATPEPLGLTEKSVSQFSFSSPSFSHANGNTSPASSPPSSRRYQANHMKFRGTFSRKVEEKPSVPQTVSVTSGTPQSTTPRSTGRAETPVFETPYNQAESPPWDYFGLLHPVENHFSTQEQMEFNQNSEYVDGVRWLREEEGISELEGEEEKLSSRGREESLESEDEFDEPSTDTLVRSFENVNRVGENVSTTNPPVMPSTESIASESKVLNGENNSPDLTPLRETSSGAAVANDVKTTPIEENEVENKIAPKDFFSSMKDIEYLFGKAFESGKEVPRMLEANKFHFRPIFPGKESESMTSSLLKSCFSCGEDPSQVQEEPPQTSVKYLTWHRTTSSRSASSRNLLGANPTDDIEDLTKNLLDSLSMVSRSHASTLDRLYAWEKKLYDEVKASQRIRKRYDTMCRLLRQQESKGENPLKTEKTHKTRAAVKDLHSRIRVAIHRIDSVSKKIEELRDTELQPQLEELIEGLRRMWEMMLDCHKLQLHVISVAYTPTNIKISIQSDSRRQITIELENELNSLSSSFTKWIGAQKTFVEAINKWLFKCVSLPQKSSKKKRRTEPPPLRNYGPPIYITCGVWLDKFDTLPTKAVTDSMKSLAAEISHFLPQQEKNQGKHANHSHSSLGRDGTDFDTGVNLLRNEALEEQRPGLDQFRISLAGFLDQLSKFAGFSVNMFTDLQMEIEKAKSNYELSKSQERKL